jgi:hypothetical protein
VAGQEPGLTGAGPRPGGNVSSLHFLSQTIGLIATAAVVGAILLFASVVAPTTFAALDAASGQRFLRRVFPRYYLYLIVASGIASACVIAFHPRLGALLAAIAVSTLVVRQVVMPRINASRDADLAGDAAAGARFRLLHRAAVAVNVLQLLVACLVLYRLAF